MQWVYINDITHIHVLMFAFTADDGWAQHNTRRIEWNIRVHTAQNGTSISIHVHMDIDGIFPKAFQFRCEKTVTEQLYADQYNL